MVKYSKSNLKYSLQEQGVYARIVADNIETILDYFSVDYRKNSKGVILGKCPVHEGDNTSALNIYIDNDVPGVWLCNTLKCHKNYVQNVFGFIQALLHKTNINISYEDAIDWSLDFLNIKKTNFSKTDQQKYITNNQFNKCFRIKKKSEPSKFWLRKDIQNSLLIPADYYIRRKYSPQIISKYDIGVHKKNQRVYIPIYNNEYNYAIGFTSRSPYEKCQKCNKYHHPNLKCPTEHYKTYEKWVNSPEGFIKSDYLFNFWFAHPYIKQTKTAILVEGPGDVLKLEDNGIHNSVATFGTVLCDEQRSNLERLGVTTLICLYDNDKAGEEAKNILKQENSRNFYLYFPSFNSKDIGDATPEDINKIKTFIKEM